jgi:hypothetical protein
LNHHRLKRLILEHGWWICLLSAFVLGIAWFLKWNEDDWLRPLTVVGGLLSGAFVLQRQYLDELKLFHDLFKDFNNRYAELTDALLSIVQSEKVDNEQDLRALIDYFNLCAEEYWWYRAGYVPHEVWRSWCLGMLQYIENAPIKGHWEQEVSHGSYYGLTLDRIRAGARP